MAERAVPRLAAVIGHADTEELLAACVAHHERLGVGYFYIVADTEMTREQTVIASLARRHNVRIVFRDEIEETFFDAMNVALTAAIEWAQPDWLLMFDSDEFCMSASPSLATSDELDDADILSLKRYNSPLRRLADGRVDPIGFDDLEHIPIVVRPIPSDLNDYAETMWPPWILTPVGPKIMFRAGAVQAVGMGGHNATAHAAGVRSKTARGLFMVHTPITTYDRFAAKMHRIRHIMETYDHRFAPYQAVHWRRWAAITARGGIAGEFERQAFDRAALAAMLAEGVVTTPKSHIGALSNA